MKRRAFNYSARRAATLPELIIVIVILGIAVTALIGVLAQTNRFAWIAEDAVKRSFYAESLMEEISMRRFSENANTVALGVDAGESSSNSLSFDDVDDYIGCSDARVINPAPGVNSSVSVSYARLNSGTWAANAGPDPYKIITVSTTGADNSSPVTISELRADD